MAELDQLTFLSVALEGATVAVSVSEVPSTRLRDVLFSVTPVTATVPEPPPLSGSSGPQEVIVMENRAAVIAAKDSPNSLLILITE